MLAAFGLYASLRLGLYRLFRERSLAVIEAKASANSIFIETMRAVQSLKIFNRESDRESQWLNRYADVVSANVRLGRTKITFTGINDVLFGLESIVTIYLCCSTGVEWQYDDWDDLCIYELQTAVYREGSSTDRKKPRFPDPGAAP